MADVRELGADVFAANVTVTTTTETAAVASDPVTLPGAQARVLIFGWLVLTTGAGTTAVTPRIRRGATVSGDLVQDAISQAVKAAAGSAEPFFVMAREERADEASVRYVLTIEQTGATGNGTVEQAGIMVMVL